MSFRMEFEVDGRRVTEAQFTQAIAEKATGMASDQVRAAVERTRCATHGQSARVVGTRKTVRGFEFEVEGCCDDLVERAQRAAFG